MPRRIPVITDEIATYEKDITRGYLGRILVNPDQVLQSESGGRGIQIYEDLLREDRVASEMQKRKLAVIGREWEIVPASDRPEDQEIADFVKEVFESFAYDQARQAMLSGIVTGFKPCEVMWEYSEGSVWIKELKGRSPRRFVFDIDNRMRMLTFSKPIEGEELPDRKFIVFRNPSENASPYGDALGRALYWPVWFKKNGVKFWAVFLEKFGQPTPWGKYPSGTPREKQDLLLEALKSMQTDNAIITPDSMAVELLEASRSSSVDSYARWEEFWNNAITFLILGQTATTEGTPGKLGAEETRAEVRREIVKADADLLCECQNQSLIPWLVDYNFPGVKRYPKVWIRTEGEKDLKPLAERDKILAVDIGVAIPKRYWYETYGIPEPEQGEEIFAPARPSGAAFSEAGRQDPSPAALSVTEAQRSIEGLKEKASDQWREVLSPMVNPIVGALLKSTNFDEALRSLQGLENSMDESKLRELLALSNFYAELVGRLRR